MPKQAVRCKSSYELCLPMEKKEGENQARLTNRKRIVLMRQQMTGLQNESEAQGTQRLKDRQHGMAGWRIFLHQRSVRQTDFVPLKQQCVVICSLFRTNYFYHILFWNLLSNDIKIFPFLYSGELTISILYITLLRLLCSTLRTPAVLMIVTEYRKVSPSLDKS